MGRARSGHTACTVPATSADAAASVGVLIFGGQDPMSSMLLNDVRWLRVAPSTAAPGAPSEARWDAAAPPPAGALPEARNGHSLTLDAAGNCLVLFGGADAGGHRNDVHRLCLPAAPAAIDMSDAAPAMAGGEQAACARGAWDAPSICGPAPPAREMHAAAVLSAARRLVVHGGRSGDELLSDVCVLDLATWRWDAPRATACTRVGHAALVGPLTPTVPDGRAFIFGGFSGDAMCNDLQEIMLKDAAAPAWQRVNTNNAPTRRFAHCAAALGATLYVFGGSAATEDLDDLHELALTPA